MPTLSNPTRPNSKGPEVRNLHAALRALGLLEKPLDDMSAMSFGVGTRDALLEFQRERGITETGVLGRLFE